MAAPVELDSFVIAPGERFDLVVDFKGHVGERVVLRSDAFEIMQFRVAKGRVEDRSSVPAALRPAVKTAEALAQSKRAASRWWRSKSGTGDSMTMLLGGRHWAMPITEDPIIDTVEIWEFVNTTEDSHPIHLHLVRFQLLDRRSFDEPLYFRTRQIRYTGPLMPPDPYEAGWKDTIRAHSKMITRIIARVSEGYVGRYVRAPLATVLEHEDNEMMRPYEVRAKVEK